MKPMRDRHCAADTVGGPRYGMPCCCACQTICSMSKPISAARQGKGPGGARPQCYPAAQVDWLEQQIDRLNGELARSSPLSCPGGDAAAAICISPARFCRRAERIMVELRDKPGRA